MFGFNYEMVTLYRIENSANGKKLVVRKEVRDVALEDDNWSETGTMPAAYISFKGTGAYVPVIHVTEKK